MVRTVISLDEKDKAWLDAKAAEEKVSMTALVRRAVKLLRQSERASGRPFEDLLERTSGMWKKGDGLEWQRSKRDEW